MKLKTKPLTGSALNWAAGVALGRDDLYPDCGYVVYREIFGEFRWEPATNPRQGWPMVEAFRIAVSPDSDTDWYASIGSDEDIYTGETPLVAAMRCFVASKLGSEVEVPRELV